jgi:hypothetical protein
MASVCGILKIGRDEMREFEFVITRKSGEVQTVYVDAESKSEAKRKLVSAFGSLVEKGNSVSEPVEL